MIPPRSAWLSALRFSGRFSVMRRTCGAGSSIRTTSELIAFSFDSMDGARTLDPVRPVAQPELQQALEQLRRRQAVVRGGAREVFLEGDVGVRVDVDQPGPACGVDPEVDPREAREPQH